MGTTSGHAFSDAPTILPFKSQQKILC